MSYLNSVRAQTAYGNYAIAARTLQTKFIANINVVVKIPQAQQQLYDQATYILQELTWLAANQP